MNEFDAEASVLGACVLDRSIPGLVASRLDREEFGRSGNRRIFEGICLLVRAGDPVDEVTLAAKLKEMGWLSEAGGMGRLAHLVDSTPTTANVEHYIRLVKRNARHRWLVRSLRRSLNRVEGPTCDVEEALNQLTIDLGRLSYTRVCDVSLASAVDSVLNEPSDVAAISTGFASLDRIVGGFEPGQLIVLAARPSMGKTALALELSLRAAESGHSVWFASLEMSASQLAKRLMMLKARRSFDEISDLPGVAAECSRIGMQIDDSAALSVGGLSLRVRLHATRASVGLVVVDYLQLMTGPLSPTRDREVAAVSQGLKRLAKEVGAPVIALSQLNRSVDSRQDKRPMLSDLRDSGAIEQDADIVMTLFREGYYDKRSRNDVVEVAVAKNRNGPTGRAQMGWIPEVMAFRDPGDVR